MIHTGAESGHHGHVIPVSGVRWVAVAALGALLLVASYVAAVRTPQGQAWENAALRGADHANTAAVAAVVDALGPITTYSLVIGVALVTVIALVRRRLDLAVASLGVIALGQLITQALKRFILPRPFLVTYSADHTPNSFPSGHTTIAMTVLFAAIIVVPYRWRVLTLLAVLPWAWGVGAYTIAARWHRLSDIIGADAVALLCACLASWWLARRSDIKQYSGPSRPGRVALVVLFSGVSVVALIVGGILWAMPLGEWATLSHPDPQQDAIAYLGSLAFTTAFPGLTALTFWGLWHRLGT